MNNPIEASFVAKITSLGAGGGITIPKVYRKLLDLAIGDYVKITVEIVKKGGD